MKKLIMLAAIALLSGCSHVTKDEAERNYKTWVIIGEMHRQYLMEDTSLETDEAIRLSIELEGAIQRAEHMYKGTKPKKLDEGFPKPKKTNAFH
jgi:hypothetical protein